jgi:hypothetical protein
MRGGARFKMNKLGAIRCPKLAGKIGTIVAIGGRNTAIALLFGNKAATYCTRTIYLGVKKSPRRERRGRSWRLPD